MTLLSLSFDFDYLPLLLVIAMAWLAPILLSLLKISKVPTVIVEILLGFVLGRFFFTHQVGESFYILEFLALSGFIFLMFLGGLEIDVDQIVASFPRRKLTYSGFLKNPLLAGISHFLIAILLSFVLTLFLAHFITIPHRWYFALIMVTTSVGIVLPVLKNRGELSGSYGQMIIISAAIADIFSIILFTFTAFIVRNGFKFDLFYILILFIVFYLFIRLSRPLKQVVFIKRLFYQLSHAASQIRVRSAVLVILIFVVLSQYIGEEVVLLGAFLSGLLMSSLLHKERSVLMIKLDGMGYGFFIPIFFIMVGIQFDPASLGKFDTTLITFLILLVISLFVIKLVPSLIWSQLFGFKKAAAGGFLMSSRLSLIIAASAIGLQLGVISPGINSSFILMAIITCLFSPVIFSTIYPVTVTEGEKTIIIGGSSTSVLLSRRMSVHGKKAIIIEKDKKRYQEIKSKGLAAIHGDGLDRQVYEKIKLSKDNFIVVDTRNDPQNLKIVSLLKHELGHDKIITRSEKMSFAEKYTHMGVESIDHHRIFATAIENYILRPSTYHDLVETFENYTIEEIAVTSRNIDGLQVKEVPFHSGAILMMIRRDRTFFIPHGESYFKIGDVLHVFGTPTAMEDVIEKVQAG